MYFFRRCIFSKNIEIATDTLDAFPQFHSGATHVFMLRQRFSIAQFAIASGRIWRSYGIPIKIDKFIKYLWESRLRWYFVDIYRKTHRSPHRKHRRHTNDLGSSMKSSNTTRHRLVATSSQLSIELSELHTLNGRLEISCLATIPARVKPGEQYADYKTYSVKSKYNLSQK